MRIFLMFAILVMTTGCALWERPVARVCQDDDCFHALAKEAAQEGNIEQAAEFCEAILELPRREDCLNSLK